MGRLQQATPNSQLLLINNNSVVRLSIKMTIILSVVIEVFQTFLPGGRLA
jgi:hypothetical protein